MKPNVIAYLCVMLPVICISCTQKTEKSKTKPPVPVSVVQAVRKDVPVQIKAIGNIEAYTSVAIKSQVSGQIAQIHFREGSDVAKGTLLVSIDPEPFQAALNQCEATLAKDQAQAKFAREQVKRYEGLLSEGIVTRDQYESLLSNADSLSAAVVADRAAVRNAMIQLEYCRIKSPVAGRTGTVMLQAGNLIKANDLPIVTINQVTPVYVSFSLPERMLADVKLAMAAGTLKVQAMIPNDPTGIEVGSISFLDNSVNASTGTIRLKGIFANKSLKLWPGQFTDLILTLASRRNAVVVPTHAIQTSQSGEFVYVVTGDKKAEMHPVTPSIVAGEETVIEKGLSGGETVVIDGQLRLTPGSSVEMKAPQQSTGTAR